MNRKTIAIVAALFVALVVVQAAGLERTREQALERYGAFSRAHARPFRIMGRLQRWVPALPPRALTALIALAGRRRPCALIFDRYLGLAPPPRQGARRRTPARPDAAGSSSPDT